MEKSYKVIISFEKQVNHSELEIVELFLEDALFRKLQNHGWTCKIEKAKIRSKKGNEILKIYPADQILGLVRSGIDKFYYDKYCINMQKNRYKIFAENHRCVCCGLEGSIMVLEKQSNDAVSHFNLYALDENNKRILMTQDHVIPTSRGGDSTQDNLQTMCFDCNNLKSNSMLQPEQIRELKELLNSYDRKLKSEKDKRKVLNMMKFFLEKD